MAFDAQAFAKLLNADNKLLEQFSNDPKGTLSIHGLEISDKEAEDIKITISSISEGRKPILILPILIAR